jgi:hypothetical protein
VGEYEMANLQEYFEDFHKKIKLDDENETLREKRDILIDKLRDRLKKMFEEKGETHPTFTHFNKGGYAMHLGVVPLNGDYDIDVGLEFDVIKDDYPDPVTVKQWVFDALFGHTDDVKFKKPCVTVQYHLNNEPCYHVDFAIYGNDQYQSSNIYLARGKPTSQPEDKFWQLDDPKGLIKLVGERFTDEDDRCQFRRSIRYLKRWKDIKFSSEGHAAPIGVGLTVAAYNWFAPSKTLVSVFQNKYEYNDLEALRQLVSCMISNFTYVQHDGETAERLVVIVPVQPYSDLFEKMTNIQMGDFKEKLSKLLAALNEAQKEADPVAACEKLQKQFGYEFPVPEIKETAQHRGHAISSSGESA